MNKILFANTIIKAAELYNKQLENSAIIVSSVVAAEEACLLTKLDSEFGQIVSILIESDEAIMWAVDQIEPSNPENQTDDMHEFLKFLEG